MKKTMAVILVLAGMAAGAAVSQLPDTNVYKLSRTKQGELGVYCANGGDATIRPTDKFGYIVVSCGK